MPSRARAHAIARAVQPIPVDEWARRELLRRQLRPVQVAARDAGAAEVELACDADGHRLPLLVEGIGAHVRDRPADRDRLAVRFLPLVPQGIDG